ncbi:uncharacterized protein C9orf43 homolog isoform X1 [Monodelphis domestica]|nr:uncharacterized protein C9orf43 homolog isoform X1 [Monodelphis domestica]
MESKMANDLEVGFNVKPLINIRLADISQLDETTCDQAICQHPHCWETIRRLQRGHPRILEPLSTTPKKSDGELDELPTLKVVDLVLPDSSILAKRINRPFFRYSGECSKFDSHLQSSFRGSHLLGFKPLKDFPGQRFDHKHRKPAKLPVLNLNASLPKCPDVGNLVMVWMPNEQGEHKKPDQNLFGPSLDKKPVVSLKTNRIIPCEEWISETADQKKKKSSQVPTGGQPCSSQLIHRWLKVPPPSPVTPPSYPHLESLPSWGYVFPKHELMSSLSEEDKAFAPSNIDQLDRTNEKNLCQERQFSKTKLILDVHRINLQSPVLNYPASIKVSPPRRPKSTPEVKRKGLKTPVQKINKAYRKSSRKSTKPHTSERESKGESKKSKELLELHQILINDSFLPQRQSMEEKIEDTDPVQSQLFEFKAWGVRSKKKKGSSRKKKRSREESLEPIQIPQLHIDSDEQEAVPLTPPSSREPE